MNFVWVETGSLMGDDNGECFGVEDRLATNWTGTSVIGVFINVGEQFVAGEQEIVPCLFAEADEVDPLFAERPQFRDSLSADFTSVTFCRPSTLICHK